MSQEAVVESVAKAKIARTTQVAKKAKEIPCKLPDVVAKGAAKSKVVDCLRDQVDGAKADAIVVEARDARRRLPVHDERAHGRVRLLLALRHDADEVADRDDGDDAREMRDRRFVDRQ